MSDRSDAPPGRRYQRRHGGHGSHDIPSLSASRCGQYPGSPMRAGANPTARAAAQFLAASWCRAAMERD
jgi:hypothetical protein